MTRRYPGKAVDASLSLEQPNAMETIYRNNWLNAHESIRSVPSVKTTSDGYDIDQDYPENKRHPKEKNGSVSSLGKYQMTLEQIRLLDLQHKDPSVTQAIKDLSGYKPSTLRRKNRRHYPGWDDLIDAQPTTDTRNSEYEQQLHSQKHTKSSKTNESPAYANVTSTKLKRSQTMRETNQTTPIFCSTLDIKDMFRRRPSPNDIPTNPCDKTLPRRRHGGSSGSNSNASTSSSANSSKKSSAEQLINNLNCDINAGHHNVEGHFRASMYDEGSDEELSFPPIEVQPKYSRDPSTRMRKASERASKSVDVWSEEDDTIKSVVLRAKSVRIQNNHQIISENDSDIRRSQPIASSRNNKFNTIAIRNSHHERPSAIELHPQRSINPHKQLPSILKTSPITTVNDISTINVAKQSTSAITVSPAGLQLPPLRRNAASSSSVDSDEFFCIPRPRLIVPVHTYARKRRTGNLLGAVADEVDDDECPNPSTAANGKSKSLANSISISKPSFGHMRWFHNSKPD